MVMGSFGPVVFSTSSVKVLNFNKFSRSVKKRTTTHEVISGKPLTEYLGADLQTISFDIKLNVLHGVKPKDMLELLNEMAEGSTAYPLVIGGMPIGDNPWCLNSVSENLDTVYSGGEIAVASVSLSLTEYIEAF